MKQYEYKVEIIPTNLNLRSSLENLLNRSAEFNWYYDSMNYVESLDLWFIIFKRMKGEI